MNKKVSIILPSYVIDAEVYGYLQRCLEALEKHTNRELYELIIVDNGSKYGSELMKSKADIYIQKDYPMGYARAVNLGFAIANGEYMCVINNDLFVQEGWLDKMLEDYGKTPGGVLAPFDHPVETGIYYDRHWYSLFLVKRDVFTKVGYLDELINYRFHDQDYSIRIKKAGFEVMRTGNVIVGHINSATYNKMERNEDPEERRVMVERHGYAHFEEWIQHANLY